MDKKIIKRNIFEKHKFQALAARGNINKLSKQTKDYITFVYENEENKVLDESILIKDDLSLYYTSMDEITFSVREKSQVQELPINIETIINKFGISLYHYITEEFDDFDGCILRGGNLIIPVIILNEKKGTYERKRFTLAHELAHYLLPKHETYLGACQTEWNDQKEFENEADEFAACLLILLC